MAEIEAAIEVIEEAGEGLELEGEAVEEEAMSAEEIEEFHEEVEEARENVEALAQDSIEFKEFAKKYVTEPGKKFATFVIKNVAIGSILYGTNIALSKLIKTGGGDQKSNKNKYAKINAITKLIKTETDVCTKVKDWMEQHQDETIILDGIEIPVESIFFKYTGPISEAVDQAYNAARPLQKKIENNVSWDIPNADDISKLIAASEAFITAFNNFLQFDLTNSSKIPVLKTLPLTQADIDDLRSQLDVIKKMPFY